MTLAAMVPPMTYQQITRPPTTRRIRRAGALATIGAIAVAGALATIGAIAVAAALAGGLAMALVVDRITLGTGLTVDAETGLTVTEETSGVPSNAKRWTVAMSADHAQAAGWTMQVADTSGTSTDLYAYFDCAAKTTWTAVAPNSKADYQATATDCETEIDMYPTVASGPNQGRWKVKQVEVTLTRNTTKLLGNTDKTVNPEFVVDNGS